MLNTETKKVAVIVSSYYYRSHADVILGRLFGNHGFNPRVKVASVYTDQVHEKDLSLSESEQYGVKIYKSIKEAVSVGYPDSPVDGIVLIGEHGDYPKNEKGQHMYPRRRFLEEVLHALDELNLHVPIFNDKHFSYNMNDSIWMYEQIQQRKLPFLGGSSIPLTNQRPQVSPQSYKSMTEVLALSWSNDTEAYGFHGLEVMQAIAELREGGETGIASIRAIEGPEVWRAMERGEWPEDLMLQAISTVDEDVRQEGHPKDHVDNPALFIVDYIDGTKGYVIQISYFVRKWASAVRDADGNIHAAMCVSGINKQHTHFETLTELIEDMVITGKSSVPIERTLITSVLTNQAMESIYQNKTIQTPELHIQYQPNNEHGEKENE